MNEFRAAMEVGDADAVIDLLSDDVVFRSPVVHAPYHGKEIVEPLVRAAIEVFKDVRYERQIGSADGPDHALVFRARVGDRDVEACDFLHVDDDGRVDELYVMVRPLSGANAVSQEMGKQLAPSA